MVTVEVPGCKPDDIEISVHGNTMSISGEKKEKTEEKKKDYYHMESRYGSFRREMILPAEVNADKIQAKCQEGVLTITQPKADKAKAKKVKSRADGKVRRCCDDSTMLWVYRCNVCTAISTHA